MEITILITTFTWISWKKLNSYPTYCKIFQIINTDLGFQNPLYGWYKNEKKKNTGIPKRFQQKRYLQKHYWKRFIIKHRYLGSTLIYWLKKISIISNFLINKKTADVIPDFKQEDKTAPKNYWLVSVLQILSKNIWDSNSKTNSRIYRLIFFTSFVWI